MAPPPGIDDVERRLRAQPLTWLVTGAAGFIGSHLVERLRSLGQTVRAIDDLSTGRARNLAHVDGVALVEGDVNDTARVRALCEGADVVLHQAALGSVPRSLANPQATHRANVDGFVAVLEAARAAGVKRVVYASSSSVYGDHPALPKVEANIGAPLSPYAASKRINEVTAQAWSRGYDMELVGLRYFNVFGARQDPDGPYAAVIPRWVRALLAGERCVIHGDGETSRDFCHVDNAVQANILAACAPVTSLSADRVYNVACGARTTLLELHAELCRQLAVSSQPSFAAFRAGDVRHSLADITRARSELGYEPRVDVRAGIAKSLGWYRGA
jgi:UDP-N-acetylglucosamine 4-epimerase